MVRYRALNRIIYKFSFEALLENFEQRICITMLRNHLFHAVVKSAVILENVSEDEWDEREEALEALRLVQIQQQAWAAHAGKHLGKFVITGQPKHEPQDGMQSVRINR